MNKKDVLSTIWVFVTINYLYCDLIGLMDASLLKQYLTGQVEGMIISKEFLLYAGILMEIPISMILLSKILPNKANAWTNVAASLVKSLVMVATLFMGTPTIYYLFFAVIEISTTIFVFVYALQWLKTLRVSSPIAA